MASDLRLYTLKRNDHAGFRWLAITVGRDRKMRSDLQKRDPPSVGRRRRSSGSAGLLADYLRTAGAWEPLRNWSSSATISSHGPRKCSIQLSVARTRDD